MYWPSHCVAAVLRSGDSVDCSRSSVRIGCCRFRSLLFGPSSAAWFSVRVSVPFGCSLVFASRLGLAVMCCLMSFRIDFGFAILACRKKAASSADEVRSAHSARKLVPAPVLPLLSVNWLLGALTARRLALVKCVGWRKCGIGHLLTRLSLSLVLVAGSGRSVWLNRAVALFLWSSSAVV